MTTLLFVCLLGVFVVSVSYFSNDSDAVSGETEIGRDKSKAKARIVAIKKLNEIETDGVPEMKEVQGIFTIATDVDPAKHGGYDQAMIIIEEINDLDA